MDPIQREWNSGLDIQAKRKLQQMGTPKEDIRESSEYLGKARCGLLCLKNNKKTAQIYVPKSRPGLFGNSIEVNPNKTNPKDINNSTTLASTLVKNNPANTFTSTSGPIEKSHGGITSTHKKSHTSLRGLSSVRKQLEQKGISIAASEIMLQHRLSKHPGESGLWCEQRGLDPTNTTTKFIIDFLTELFEKGIKGKLRKFVTYFQAWIPFDLPHQNIE